MRRATRPEGGFPRLAGLSLRLRCLRRSLKHEILARRLRIGPSSAGSPDDGNIGGGMSWTSAQDVIGGWIGEKPPTDEVKVGIWIERAERLVRRNVPDLQARLDVEADLMPESTDLLDTVRDVVVEMVTQVFRNPDGYRSIQTTEGPFTDSTTWAGDTPGQLVFTDAHAAALAIPGERPGDAFVVDLFGGY